MSMLHAFALGSQLVIPTLVAPPPAASTPSFDSLAPHAAALALAQVVAIEEVDSRPSDGDLFVVFTLRLIRSSGAAPSWIRLVKDYGGLSAPGSPCPKLPAGPLKPDSLKKGETYWLAFASRDQYFEFAGGIINLWPQADPLVAPIMEEALRSDRCRWTPNYVPALDLSYGFDVDPKSPTSWRLRAERRGQVLWTRLVPGARGQYAPYLQSELARDQPFGSAVQPQDVIFAEGEQDLAAGNEFGLPPGKYVHRTAFNPLTGDRVHLTIHPKTTPGVDHPLRREYQPGSGALVREIARDYLTSGGIKAGAKSEAWVRLIIRTFDPASGKLATETTYRCERGETGETSIPLGN